MKLITPALLLLMVAPQDSPSTEELLKQLASEHIEHRTRAEQELLRRGDAAVPLLERAAREGDREVAGRARAILNAIARLRTLTPRLIRVIPQIRDRLACGDPHPWTRAFLEAAEQKGTWRRHPELAREDLIPLVGPALRGAEKSERPALAAIVAAWRLPAGIELLPYLDDPDWNVRGKAIESLGVWTPRELAPHLLERYKRENESTKSLWLNGLARMGAREAIPEIKEALLSGKREFSGSAAQLAQLDAVEAVPVLTRLLADPVRYESHELIWALVPLAPGEVLPAVSRMLAHEKPEIRDRGIAILSQYYRCAAAVPLLRGLLRHAEPRVRSSALSALGPYDPVNFVSDLKTALEDDSPAVRRSAAILLASRGFKESLPEILLMLRSPQSRAGAARALLDLRGREALTDLIPLLREPDNEPYFIETMAGMGVEEARPHVLKFLQDEGQYPRHSTAWCLRMIDGPAALPALRKMLKDEDLNMRWAALREMAAINSPEVLEEIKRVARGDDPDLSRAAIHDLARLSPADAVSLLLKELEGSHPWSRAQACSPLATLKVAEAIPRIKTLLTDPDEYVRRSAAEALAWSGDREALPILMSAGDHANRFLLNAYRRPDLWKALGSESLQGPPLTGSYRAMIAEAGRRAKLTIDAWDEEPISHLNSFPVEGRSAAEVLGHLLWYFHGAILEPGRIRLLSQRETRRFWTRWWAEECLKSPHEDERAEGRRLLLQLEESNKKLKELANLKVDRDKPGPEQVRGALTPALKAIPGLEERLVRGDDDAWTAAFLELAGKAHLREFSHLRQADFESLVGRALKGVLKTEDLVQILQASSRWRLTSARPVVDRHLSHASASVRVGTATLLLTLDGASALTRVLPLLDDADPESKTGIVRAFGACQIKEAIPHIMARADDPAIKRGLLDAAASLELEEAIPLILPFADKPNDYNLRTRVVYELMALGSPALNDDLRRLLRVNDHPAGVEVVISALSQWGAREAIPQLVELIETPGWLSDVYVPRAFLALGSLGAREASPLILKALKGKHVRGEVIRAAVELGLTEAVPHLRELLRSDNAHTVAAAAEALGSLGDRPSLPKLREQLGHKEGGIRGGAASALALLKDTESYGRIVTMAKDAQHAGALRRALSLIRSREALALLAERASYPGAETFAAMGTAGADLVPSFGPSLASADVWTRHGAVQALGRIDGPEALAELKRRMDDPSEAVREAAAQMLCRRGLPEGVPATYRHSLKKYYPLPFELNGVRSPETWARLRGVKLKKPFYGTPRDLVTLIAGEAGLAFEDLPADSRERPPWTQTYLRLHEAALPLTGLDAIDYLSQHRWMIVLDPGKIRVLPRKEVLAFWKEWSEREKK